MHSSSRILSHRYLAWSVAGPLSESSRSSAARNGIRLPSYPVSQNRFLYSCSAVTRTSWSRKSICTRCGKLPRKGAGRTIGITNNRMHRPSSRRMFSSHLRMVRMVSGCLYLGLETLWCTCDTLVNTDRQSGYWITVKEFLNSLNTPW